MARKKKKSKTIAQLVEIAAEAMQLYVRVKAADEQGYVRCVTCGCVRHYKDQMDGGHFIERSYLATKLLEENIHPQCKTCNGPFGNTPKGNPVQYTLYMEDTYGRDFIDELERLRNESRKYYRAEVEEITKEIRAKIRQIQKEKGI